MLLSEDLWFLHLCLKLIIVDPTYCMVALLYWLLFFAATENFVFVLFLSFITFQFKIFFVVCYYFVSKFTRTTVLKLDFYFYCIAVEYFLYWWFSTRDVIIKFKNCYLILELTVKLNGRMKNFVYLFHCILFLYDRIILSYFKLSL